jgi:DNA adenine methylase
MSNNQYSFLPVRSGGAKAGENPVLSWPGAKGWLAGYLVPLLLPLLKPGVLYFEPFVGSAAILLALRSAGWAGRAVCSDVNADLILLYQVLQSGEAPAIAVYLNGWLEERKNRERVHFEELREKFNTPGKLSHVKRAAAVIYLSKLGFNGLWRMNKKGLFNGSFGGKERSFDLSAADIVALGEKLARVAFFEQSYEVTISTWKKGEEKAVWYFDPPYLGTFDRYTTGGFGLAEHEKLGALVRELAGAGHVVVVSNSLTTKTKELYAGARVHEIPQSFTIGGSAATRELTKEALFVFGQ